MTPKEKIHELCTNFKNIPSNSFYYAMSWEMSKECAIITVNEILKIIPMYTGSLNPEWEFWYQVKKDLENI